MTYNYLNRHIAKHGNQTAIIHDFAMSGNVTDYDNNQLIKQVKISINILSKKYQVKKGDMVPNYMPIISEVVVMMLAYRRIRAIHTLILEDLVPVI